MKIRKQNKTNIIINWQSEMARERGKKRLGERARTENAQHFATLKCDYIEFYVRIW